MVPDNCIVIQNKYGTAPGMLFQKNDKVIVSMPGVPYEMKGMVEHFLIPYLKENFALPVILHRNILTAGVGETVLSERLKTFETTKDPRVRLAYLPSVGKVRLRLTVKGNSKDLEQVIEQAKTEVVHAIREFIYGYDDDQLEKNIGELLLRKKLQLGTAESCTGGYLAHLITSVPGSSAYFKGSVIAYSNEIKQSILHVKKQTLEAFGAVSEETVHEMLRGALQALNIDIAVAISGIAGPSGGTEEKPVGTVYIGVASRDRSNVKKLSFTNNRERNIQLSAVIALVMLRKFLIGSGND
jgi:nicotinamide-nucleotide amidase